VEDITLPPDDVCCNVNGTSKARMQLIEQNKSAKFFADAARCVPSSRLYNIKTEQKE
jgi:hypothetical protein